MKMSKNDLLIEASRTGFRPEILEKVILLLALLEQFSSLSQLKNRFALKGGTALNLFCFDQLARLSVDIDLNYIGSPNREIMLVEKPLIEEALLAIYRQNQFEIYRNPREHAGGKTILRYQSALGHTGNLEVDLNYMYRVPLWNVAYKNSHQWPFHAKDIPVLDMHELAAGKLHALFSRHASRDLFDTHHLLSKCAFDIERLRLAFVTYMAASKKDWRDVQIKNIEFDVADLKNNLLPVLRKSESLPTSRIAITQWAESLVSECRTLLKTILPFTEAEQAFLTKVQTHGEIDPTLICADHQLIEKILAHPALHWRVKN